MKQFIRFSLMMCLLVAIAIQSASIHAQEQTTQIIQQVAVAWQPGENGSYIAVAGVISPPDYSAFTDFLDIRDTSDMSAVLHLADNPQMHIKTVYSLAWSPDGTRIAYGAEGNMLRVIDASNGTELASYPTGGIANTVPTNISWKGNQIAFPSEALTPPVFTVPPAATPEATAQPSTLNFSPQTKSGYPDGCPNCTSRYRM
jgi:WD40 repeat protein